MRKFNIVLLDRWYWRMVVERGGLWFRVLAWRYDVEGDRLIASGRDGSMWWRGLVRTCAGVGLQVSGWFEDNLR